MSQHKIAGLVGSLRKGSYNRALMRAAIESAPPELEIEIAEILDVPLYNQDVEDEGLPESVVELKRRVEEADAVLIATPEYNQSVPGVLKNAIDWLSRPPKPQSLDGKPAAIMGATPGMWGTRAAQYHLRQSLVGVNALTMPQPMMLVKGAASVFDGDLKLVDEKTGEFLAKFLASFTRWIATVNGDGSDR